MLEGKAVINNETGIHARPANLFVKECQKFRSNINLIKDEKVANAKSILNVLALGLDKGSEIIVQAEGEDEKEAVETLVHFINTLED